MSTAEYQRRWRARHPATRPPGRPPEQPCGTLAAYRRHLRRGEATCQPCKDANAEYGRNQRKDH
jgi:hypothetical protein